MFADLRAYYGLARSGRPGSLSLPADCRTFVRGPVEVYDIACIAAR